MSYTNRPDCRSNPCAFEKNRCPRSAAGGGDLLRCSYCSCCYYGCCCRERVRGMTEPVCSAGPTRLAGPAESTEPVRSAETVSAARFTESPRANHCMRADERASSTDFSNFTEPASSTDFSGSDGPANTTGLNGSDGPANATGLAGSDRPANATGLAGSDRPANATGLNGSNRSANATGLNGSDRSANATGLTGSDRSDSLTDFASSDESDDSTGTASSDRSDDSIGTASSDRSDDSIGTASSDRSDDSIGTASSDGSANLADTGSQAERTWPVGAVSTSGSGVLIPFSSGPPIVLTWLAGGLAGIPAFVGFGSSTQGLTMLGGSIDLTNPLRALNNIAFQIPREGTITSFGAYFNTTAAISIPAGLLTVTAQLYQSTSPDNVFHPIAETCVSLSPALSGGIASGKVLTGALTGLSIPLAAHSRLMLVYSVSGTEAALPTVLTGSAIAGLAIN